MANLWGHLKTITHHRHLVIVHCAKAGILWQGLRHDLSKYAPVELIPGARYFSDGSKSPNEQERREFGYSWAWLHHKGRNRHHFEYWADYDPVTRKYGPVPMPIRYAAEMFCDRVAASKNYQKENYRPDYALAYFQKGKGKRMIHPETSDLLEHWLVILAEQGEDAAFAEVRKAVKGK